jgi:hypothetical protein
MMGVGASEHFESSALLQIESPAVAGLPVKSYRTFRLTQRPPQACAQNP